MKAIADIGIAGVTLACCLYIIASMLWWTYSLRKQFLRSPIAWIFLSIIFAKLAIADWAQVNLNAMINEGLFPPLYTLRPRIMIMISVFIQIVALVVIWRRQHPDKHFFRFWLSK